MKEIIDEKALDVNQRIKYCTIREGELCYHKVKTKWLGYECCRFLWDFFSDYEKFPAFLDILKADFAIANKNSKWSLSNFKLLSKMEQNNVVTNKQIQNIMVEKVPENNLTGSEMLDFKFNTVYI